MSDFLGTLGLFQSIPPLFAMSQTVVTLCNIPELDSSRNQWGGEHRIFDSSLHAIEKPKGS